MEIEYPHKFYYEAPQFCNGKQGTDTIYSDRLLLWDRKKHDELCLKHFGNKGQHWGAREPEKIEAFLSDFTGKCVELCLVEEHVNASNGYPYWRFDFLYV